MFCLELFLGYRTEFLTQNDILFSHLLKIDEVLKKALARQPNERYESFENFIRELKQALPLSQ